MYFDNNMKSVFIYIPLVAVINAYAITVTAQRIFHNNESYDFYVTFILETILVKVIGSFSLISMIICFSMVAWPGFLRTYHENGCYSWFVNEVEPQTSASRITFIIIAAKCYTYMRQTINDREGEGEANSVTMIRRITHNYVSFSSIVCYTFKDEDGNLSFSAIQGISHFVGLTWKLRLLLTFILIILFMPGLQPHDYR
ncbi:hypothetical protein BDC45DRAFT_529369 [Circinella umbellata]|nr:hypothetical protein BDC45DRAFT_529369 [Circinella umbellata]